MPQGYELEREIFNSLEAIDGRFKGMTQQQRNSRSVNMVENTNRLLRESDYILTIKEDHFPKTELLQGAITGVRFTEKPMPGEAKGSYISIIGKIFITEGLYNLYTDGLLPRLSAETKPAFNMQPITGRDNDILGEHISGLAFVGASQPAMNLDNELVTPPAAVEMFFTADKNKIYIPDTPQEGFTMEEDKEKKEQDVFAIVEGLFKKYFSMIMPKKEDGKDKPEKKKEEEEDLKCKDKKENFTQQEDIHMTEMEYTALLKEHTALKDSFAAQTAQIAELQVKNKTLLTQASESHFTALVSDGKATIDDKADFTALCETMGLDFTSKHYTKNRATPNTTSSVVTNTAQTKTSNFTTEENQEIREHMEAGGDAEAVIEAINERRMEAKNGLNN